MTPLESNMSHGRSNDISAPAFLGMRGPDGGLFSPPHYGFSILDDLYLLYAPPLRHVTSCCINRFQSASRIDMPC